MTQNIRKELAETFAAALEKGCPPWRAGWSSASPPMNPCTDRPYNGMNRIILMQAVADCDGEYRFMTLKQASAMGYKIRRGAKAFRIVRIAEVDRNPDEKPPENSEIVAEDKSKRLILRVHHVFNGRDIEGLPALEKPAHTVEPVEAAQQVVDGMKASGLVVLEGGDKACYMPKMDTVRVPDRWRFKGGNKGVATAEFWSTLLHECAHATSHEKRMDRKLAKFGTEAYSREELRAEIASAFLSNELGVPMAESLLESHSAYIANWASVLRSEPQEIFKAAADAQRIADYLKEHALKPEAKIENTENVVASPNVETVIASDVLLEAANEPAPKRRQAGLRM